MACKPFRKSGKTNERKYPVVPTLGLDKLCLLVMAMRHMQPHAQLAAMKPYTEDTVETESDLRSS